MAITWGDYSTARNIAITPADVQVGSITAPIASTVFSSSVTITYTLTSDQSPDDPELVFYVEFDKQGYGIDAQTWILADIQAEYSIDGASTYTTCTEDTVSFSALSEGTENLLTSVAGEIHNYVWALLTDLGTNDYLTNVYIRLKAYDGASWSAYLASSAFTVDTVPTAPTYNSDSYSDGDKLKDTTPDFHFTIPTDVGSDRLHFKIDWDTSDDFNSSDLISRNSYDNDGFWHYHNNVDPSGSYTINDYKKYGDWYFQITGVTTGGNYAFGDYKDYYKDIYLPAEFIDPKVIIYGEADALFYLSAISTTGFTVGLTADVNFPDRSELTGGTSTVLHCHLFEGIWSEYWVSDLNIPSTSKVITYGSGDFVTDDNGNIIENIDENCMIVLQPQSDAIFYISSHDASGMTIGHDATMGTPSSSDLVTVFIVKTKTDLYYKQYFDNLSTNTYTVYLSGTDENGETVPNSIPGIQFLMCPENETFVYLQSYRSSFYTSTQYLIKRTTHIHRYGSSARCYFGFYGCNADDFWVPIVDVGISEDYELEKAKFQVQAADVLSSGSTYYYRVAAGNE